MSTSTTTILLVSDLAESNWDWSQGEPPEDNPSYYLRYNKSFSRMGGTMRYLQADNRDFLLALTHRARRGEPLMDASIQLSDARLEELISRFARSRIAVIGDFFLDKYLDVDPALVELSVETGKPAHQVVGIRCSPGAAGTVVCNLAALGAGQLHAVGFAGDDGEGFDLRKQLTQLGCSTDHLHVAADRHTPTYLKPRDSDTASLAAEHSRYDTKNRTSDSARPGTGRCRIPGPAAQQTDAVIMLDQVEEPDCGVVTEQVRSRAVRPGRSGTAGSCSGRTAAAESGNSRDDHQAEPIRSGRE